MRTAKIHGVQIILNNWFIALLILFFLAGMGGKALAVFSAVMLHETAHALAARMLGLSVSEIELLPFGGVARIDRLSESGSMSEMVIAAAGPATSLVLAAAMHMAAMEYTEWFEALSFYAQVNLTLALFNLIPGLPLDGGRIMRALLMRRMDYARATAIVGNISSLVALCLAGYMVFDYLTGAKINLTLLIAAVFLHVAARTEMKIAGFRQMRVLANKKEQLSVKGIMPVKHFTAMSGLSARAIVNIIGPEHYYIILIIDEQFCLRGTLTETEVWEGLPKYGLCSPIGKFLN